MADGHVLDHTKSHHAECHLDTNSQRDKHPDGRVDTGCTFGGGICERIREQIVKDKQEVVAEPCKGASHDVR